MDVVYTCDNNYIWIMGISIISLFECNKGVKELNIYLLGDNIWVDNKNQLNNIAKQYGRNFHMIDIPEINIPKGLCNQRWPRSAYIRLFSGKLLPNSVNKVLYLDCDTIVTGDISELWQIDISDFTIYGVKDCVGKAYNKNIGLDINATYVNAGVLLINLEKLREISMSQCIDSFLRKYSKLMSYSDQDVLNGIFCGKFGILHPKYDVMTLLYSYNYDEVMTIRRPNNYYTKDEICMAKMQPCIVHFTTCMLAIRPWFLGSQHPYASQFQTYKEKSPWAEKEMLSINFGSTKGKALKIVLKLPKLISLPIIGYIHSFLKPYFLRIKSMFAY